MSNLRQLQLYKQNQIATADPGKILLMLYEGVIDALKRATQHLAAGNMAEKGICILQAHDIITQFVVSLDYEIGGELAYNLETLYRYMLDQILRANVKNDPGPLAEVISLLSTLKDGWESAVVAQRRRVAPRRGVMSIVMRDLEAVRDGNLKLLAVPDHDTRQIQKWGTQRELIFARLQEGNLQLSSDERAAAAPLVNEILELDAEVLARLQQYQATLSRKRTGAVKMQQALAASEGSHSSVLLQRVA